MSDTPRRKAEELFQQAVDLPPEQRGPYLDEHCEEEPALRADVESLLANVEDDNFASLQGVEGLDEEDGDLVGERIGPYKLVELVGEGGFGSVYMAEQEEPVRRRVALKIVKLGMDTKQVVARFDAERQALAMMDHPNIARVFDAGATGVGRPYFVMELVRGIPITEFSDQNHLSTRQRLELFISVCRAVQHAHQKGVIHRDLKPSNVMVTLHDGMPVPKIIDFGIAKAIEEPLTDKTCVTGFRQFVGTPEYVSPEQAELSGLDVDTRTDIYSLGVLLYELLTGTTPFDSKTLRNATYEEVQRIIREQEPITPSRRVSTLGEALPRIAKARRAEPHALCRLVRGDLDWIVMKALEKDRTRRYETAADLATDIRRHLDSEPVSAGPPDMAYKLAKFVRRNRVAVGAGSVVAAALICGVVVATTFYFQAATERDAARMAKARADQEAARSQTIADFLQDLFISTDPTQAIARDLDVETVVARARDVFGDDHATVAATLSSRALQLQSAGELEAAERLYNESLRVWRELYGDENINVATTLSALGMLLLIKGDDAGAKQVLRESIRITRSLPHEDNLAICETLSMLAQVLGNRGEYDEAEELLRESIRVRRAVAPHQRLQVAVTLDSLSTMLNLAGRSDALTASVPESLEAWRQAVPGRGPLMARILAEYGIVYLLNDRPDKAGPLLKESLDIFHSLPGPPLPQYRFALQGVYEMLDRSEQRAEKIRVALRALEIIGRMDNPERLREAERNLGNFCWHIAKDRTRARDEYELALKGVETYLEGRPDAYAAENTRGVLLYRLKRYEEALTVLQRSGELHAKQEVCCAPCDSAFMAMAQHRLGQYEQARAALARFRLILQDPEYLPKEENKSFLSEAEALIGKAETSEPDE
jgi:serine/threonine protein kinase